MLCWCHLDILGDAVLGFVLVSPVGQGTQALGASAPCGRPSATSCLLYPKRLQKCSPSCHCPVMAPACPAGAWRSWAAQGLHEGQVPGWTTRWVNLSPTPTQIPAGRVRYPWGSNSPGQGRLGAVRPKSARLGPSFVG